MIKIFNLANGDQIIGDVQETRMDRQITIHDPLHIAVVDDDLESVPGIRVEDAMLFSDERFLRLESEHVLYTVTPSTYIVELYNAYVEFNIKHGKSAINHEIVQCADRIRELIKLADNKRQSVLDQSQFKKLN